MNANFLPNEQNLKSCHACIPRTMPSLGMILGMRMILDLIHKHKLSSSAQPAMIMEASDNAIGLQTAE